ncbi:MAG TPA: hypothetical protein VF515_11035 [Candidatus Binatia bacterium]
MTADLITGCLAGAQFAFRCDAPDLCDYTRIHLAPSASDQTSAPAVTAMLRWHDGQPPANRAALSSELSGLQRLDRDIYASNDRLWWFRVDDLRDLHLRFAWADNGLKVEGDFYYRLGNTRASDRIRRVRQWRRRRALRQRRFSTLLYYLVYYPCWWWLEQMQDLHPIHAAGVDTGDGVVLLAGASGVGKSTLAVALAGLPGAALLSDSFVLHHGTKVFGVREPVLLDDWSVRWLGAQARDLRRIDGRFCLDREGYHPPSAGIADGGEAALLVFPRRAPFAFVRPLSATEACQRLSAVDLIVNDLRRYWAFAAVLEQMFPAGLVAQRERHLAQLTAAVPCYDVGVTAEMTSTAAAQSIVQLMRAQPPRAAGAHL